MNLLLIFLVLLIIATNSFAPKIAESFRAFHSFGAKNLLNNTNRQTFKIETYTSPEEIMSPGAHLRQYPHYSLSD